MHPRGTPVAYFFEYALFAGATPSLCARATLLCPTLQSTCVPSPSPLAVSPQGYAALGFPKSAGKMYPSDVVMGWVNADGTGKVTKAAAKKAKK